jgi:hypothetical protein
MLSPEQTRHLQLLLRHNDFLISIVDYRSFIALDEIYPRLLERFNEVFFLSRIGRICYFY